MSLYPATIPKKEMPDLLKNRPSELAEAIQFIQNEPD